MMFEAVPSHEQLPHLVAIKQVKVRDENGVWRNIISAESKPTRSGYGSITVLTIARDDRDFPSVLTLYGVNVVVLLSEDTLVSTVLGGK